MSGISVLFHREPRPASRDVIERMMAAAPHRGPDGARSWAEGPVALGHQLLRTEHEEHVQPLVDASRRRAIVFHGRLDNRDELTAQLSAADPTDAALTLMAYDMWGDACPARLLGDFAFAIWDAGTRTMFCARDVMGVKPFYYHVSHQTLVIASELRQIVASGELEVRPNEGMVAEYLAASVRSQGETLYRGVMRLPAAHTMTVTETGIKLRRYWQLEPDADVTCRDDHEYAERFSDLFRDAVACRMRGGPVAFFLSGGLDSSSVVATAAALGAKVETFSMVFPGHESLDESRYIDDVVASCGATAHVTTSPRPARHANRRNIASRRDVADLPCDVIGESLLAMMKDRGARVALSGHGGDHAFAGSIYHYADLLRSRDYVAFARQLWADARTPDNGWSILDPLLCGVRPLLSHSVRNALRPLARRVGLVPGEPDWIDRRFASRVSLQDRLRAGDTIDAPTFGRRTACENYESGWLFLVNEMTDCRAAEYGLDERHPFLDRRVVEFAVGIPESQRWHGRETKVVVRRAIPSLPRSVRTRTDKADFTPCVVDAFDALGGPALFRRLRIGEVGWVSQQRVDELCREMERLRDRRDNALSGVLLNLWMIACVELWFRLEFAKGSADDYLEEHLRRPESAPRRAAAEAGVSAA